MKVTEILNEETVLPDLWRIPVADAKKIIKGRTFSLTPGEWKKGNDGMWESGNMGIKFYSITSYSKSGRLRLPSKTRYQVYVTLYKNGNSITVDFGSATVESDVSREKIENAKEKVIAWAKKAFDIELTQYSFNF